MRYGLWIALGVAGAMGLSGCNDSDSSTQTAVSTGYLYDDVVGGLEYITPTQHGYTEADGSFKYFPREKVTFKLGNLTIGEAVAGETLTLFDLVANSQKSDGSPSDEVIKMATLLQSLDEDLDPNNGITITEATRARFLTLAAQTFSADTNLTRLISDSNLTVTLKDPAVAEDHLISSVSIIKGAETLATQTYSSGAISAITRYTVDTTGYDVDYNLSSSVHQLPIGIGSSLRLKSSTNGTMVFYALTDRGPNGDASEESITDAQGNTYSLSKSFPVPTFVPQVAEVTVKGGKAIMTKTTKLKASDGVYMSGLPIQSGTTGSTGEVALNDTLHATLDFDANGIDPEGIDIDSNGNLWISDEYGPFIAKVDPATGKILKKYNPGAELPEMLKNRVPNRGMEGLTVVRDAQNGDKVYGIVQTPLASNGDGKADDTWLTLVELDVNSGTVNLYAVPFDLYNKTTNVDGFKTSKVKVGDLASLGNGKFLMIEQGKTGSGTLRNNIVMIDLANATVIDSSMYTGYNALSEINDVSQITPATRTYLLNLRDYGWLPEKAEGLSIVDANTIAIINDNDFGIAALAQCTATADGSTITVDATGLSVDLTAAYPITHPDCVSGTAVYSITKNDESERRTRLWMIRLTDALY